MSCGTDEIMTNSPAEVKAIYDKWFKIHHVDPSKLKPVPVELGRGNPKCAESVATAVYNSSKFATSKRNNYLPDSVMLQNPGLEESQELIWLWYWQAGAGFGGRWWRYSPSQLPSTSRGSHRKRNVIEPEPENEEPCA